jgi:hypothetical protein
MGTASAAVPIVKNIFEMVSCPRTTTFSISFDRSPGSRSSYFRAFPLQLKEQ